MAQGIRREIEMRKVIWALMCFALSGVLMAGNSGAIANFSGEVSVNGHAVPESTAVFPGDKLATGHNAAAYISRPGFTMVVGSESSAELLANGVRILDGVAEATLKPGSEILYADLHISAASDSAKLKIEAHSGSQMIGAYSGDLTITDGVKTVSVPQGQALYAKAKAEPQGRTPTQLPTSGNVTLRGTVTVKDGNYFLTDRTTGQTVQLTGKNLGRFVGQMVRVNGTVLGGTPAGGASRLIAVSHIMHVAGAAAGGAAAGTAPAVTGGGLSTGTIAAIGGGLAVGGTLGGLAATGTFGGNNAPPISPAGP